LTDVLARLGMQPWDLCRLTDPTAVSQAMADWPRDAASAPRWIRAMAVTPALIQRPILLLDDGSAVLGRTAEALDEAARRAPR
jgi:arsenate reductase